MVSALRVDPSTRPVAFYDARCGFCSRSMDALGHLRVRVDTAPIGSELFTQSGLDPQRAEIEMPVVRSDGSTAWGHHAWAAILRTSTLPVLRAAAAVLDSRAIERPASSVYAWVATHRELLPGGTAACAVSSPGEWREARRR